MAQGTALLDFGAFPGVSDISLFVSAPTIAAGSLVQAEIFPADTADHSADEHIVDPPDVTAGNIVAGSGFTIYGVNRDKNIGGKQAPGDVRGYGGGDTRIYGKWNVLWAWNT